MTFKSLVIALLLLMSVQLHAAQKVNINTADAAQLSSGLFGVGEKKAEAIIAWREANGPFRNMNDVAKVKGIGPKLLEKNKQRIRFSGGSETEAKPQKSATTENAITWPGR